MIKRVSMAMFLSIFLVAFGHAPSFAQTAHTATVTKIVDGDTLFIDRPFMDSREVRLVGIQAPKLPLGRANFDAWPLADEAKTYLANLTLGKTVELSFGGRRMDRHGRLLAHLHTTNEAQNRLWVQAAMLRNGLARVYSFFDNRSFIPEMLDAEKTARVNRVGIWDLPFYAIRNADPDTLSRYVGSFQLIEGRIVDTARVKGRVYLNFGADWRTDFTARVARKNHTMFRDANLELLSLVGRSVRVRGWLGERNGPSIELTHPEQLEILSR